MELAWPDALSGGLAWKDSTIIMTDITTNDMETEPSGEGWRLPPPAAPKVVVSDELAAQLVDQARTDGVDLVGPGVLLGDLTKRVLEAGLEAEMTEHVGYDKHDPEGRNRQNSRNGTRSKRVFTEVGPCRSTCPAIVTAASSRSWCANARGAWPVWTRW